MLYNFFCFVLNKKKEQIIFTNHKFKLHSCLKNTWEMFEKVLHFISKVNRKVWKKCSSHMCQKSKRCWLFFIFVSFDIEHIIFNLPR